NFATLHVYDALARVHGVGQVVVFGARDYGMRIWLDPAKMARLGVTTQDVSTILNEQNVVAPAGTVGAEPAPPGQQMQYVASVQGRLSSPEQYGNIVVRTGADGAIVHLKDIARVELAALIPMLAIPVSLIGAFSAFIALGFSLNTLTLFALVLAIGLVVDDAIVVVEAVSEIMDSRKLSAREATKAAMKEVSGPVVAI